MKKEIISAWQYRFVNKQNPDNIQFYVFPTVSETKLAEINKNLKNFVMSFEKDVILPIYKFTDCYSCISISDLRKIAGNQVADAFNRFMSHQTRPLLFDLPTNEQDFCYAHDWENFLYSGRLFWD